jgi:hypothetical protein
MAKQAILIQKSAILTNGKLLTDRLLLDRDMNLDECKANLHSLKISAQELRVRPGSPGKASLWTKRI